MNDFGSHGAAVFAPFTNNEVGAFRQEALNAVQHHRRGCQMGRGTVPVADVLEMLDGFLASDYGYRTRTVEVISSQKPRHGTVTGSWNHPVPPLCAERPYWSFTSYSSMRSLSLSRTSSTANCRITRRSAGELPPWRRTTTRTDDRRQRAPTSHHRTILSQARPQHL